MIAEPQEHATHICALTCQLTPRPRFQNFLMDASYDFCNMASLSQLYPYAAGIQDLQALLKSTGGVDKQELSHIVQNFEAGDLF